MKCNYQKGNTLYEVLLYISLSVIIMSAIFSLMYFTYSSNSKNKAIRYVEKEGTHLLTITTDMIRNSESVNSPTVGNTSSQMSLDYDGSTYVWSLNNGQVQYVQDSLPAVFVTSGEVVVTDLEFQNYSQAGTPGVVTMSFTMSRHIGGNLSRESNFTQEYRGGASARPS